MNDCIAVGTNNSNTAAAVPLAEIWNGTRWTAQAIPAPPGSSSMSGVSCGPRTPAPRSGSTPTAAPGCRSPSGGTGTAWTLQAAAIPPGGSSGLDGVSCPTASTCFAVGTGTDSGGSTVPLAEKWDGTRWTIQATPEPAGAFIGALLAVSCRDTGGCTAAGTYYKGIVERILIERLRNGRWNVQRAPNAWWPARAKIRASPRA